VWWLCFLLWGGCVCNCLGVVFVIVWRFCLLLFGGCVCYCEGVVFVIVIIVGCSNLIMLFGMSLVLFEVGASSGVDCANLTSVH